MLYCLIKYKLLEVTLLCPYPPQSISSKRQDITDILYQCLFCFLFLSFTPTPLSFSPSLCRCAARDADASGEEDLSVFAHGGHTAGHSVLPDKTVQTLIRTHQKRQVSTQLNFLEGQLAHGVSRQIVFFFYSTRVKHVKFQSVVYEDNKLEIKQRSVPFL